MPTTRTLQIVNRVAEQLKREEKPPLHPDVVLATLDDIQLEIAQRALAIKFERDILLEKGTDIYDLKSKIFQIRTFVEPKSWRHRLTIVTDTDDWAEIVRELHGNRPTHCIVWDGKLRFHPTPQITGEKLGVFLYLLPSEKLELTTEPETGPKFDTALRYGAFRDLIGGDWGQTFESELSRVGLQETKEVSGTPHIRHGFMDRLGF